MHLGYTKNGLTHGGIVKQYNSLIATFYRRQLDDGEVKKVVLLACMRQLLSITNAMIRNITVWNPELINEHVVTEAK